MSAGPGQTLLTIDLGAIVANWRTLRNRRVSGATGAVIKADGYGLGAARVAAALSRAGCQYFFVATADEALPVRDTIPDADLVVLNGLRLSTADDLAARGIMPALGSLGEIDGWSRLARRLGRKLPAFLHFDTGLSRLGLDTREFGVLAGDHARLDGIDVRFVMSHLASSEVPDDPLNHTQSRRFIDGCARLPSAPRCLANSSGMFLDLGCDLARPGAALYGINPTPSQPNPMRNAVTLMAEVLAVRDIPAGASVGYNATWSAARASRIATVGVGYADGWQRGHSNKGAAYFDGHPVPLVGRVSMDLTTYDVTDLPAVQPGSWLELLGPNCPADTAARDRGTIGYEVLTSLGQRYQRVYLSE